MAKVKSTLERMVEESEALDKEHTKLSIAYTRLNTEMNEINLRRNLLKEAIRSYKKSLGEE